MLWLSGILIGTGLGLGAGLIAERVPAPPILQSVAAWLTAMLLGAVSTPLVWFLRSAQAGSGGLGAVSPGISVVTFALLFASLFLLPAAGHVALGRIAAAAPPLSGHRPVVLGIAGGLCGALLVTWLIAAFTQPSSV